MKLTRDHFYHKGFSDYCCGNNNKDEDNSPKTLNDKNHQSSSQKFRQLIRDQLYILCFIVLSQISSNLSVNTATVTNCHYIYIVE